jgi:hypothetical protein
MSIISIVAETAEHSAGIEIFIPPAIAFVAFLALGVVVWSYRDVANRQAPKATGSAHASDAHTAGH